MHLCIKSSDVCVISIKIVKYAFGIHTVKKKKEKRKRYKHEDFVKNFEWVNEKSLFSFGLIFFILSTLKNDFLESIENNLLIISWRKKLFYSKHAKRSKICKIQFHVYITISGLIKWVFFYFFVLDRLW